MLPLPKPTTQAVKGLEAPMHDPRSAHGYGLAYATSPRGACHGASLQYPVEGGNFFFEDIPELAVELEEQSSEGKAKLNAFAQDFGMFFSHCASYCHLGAMPMNGRQCVDLVNHVTGHDYTIDELMYLGRRIWYVKRALSNIFGARKEHDRLPKRMMTPLEEGPSAGSVPDMDLMLREFYELRKFNENGVPSREVLEELDLLELVDLLYRD
jgi:aldehyde:ferredoxin oxidoreductase